MWLIYLLVNDFGWAVVLFTLIVKAVSFPLTLKQQKNQAVSQLFTPRVQEIQRKYRGQQQKLQEEMAKLQKEGYNPMGGCGSMLLTMIILFGVIDVVYKPMTHMERFNGETVDRVIAISTEVEYSSIILENDESLEAFLGYAELDRSDISIVDGSKVSNDAREKIGARFSDQDEFNVILAEAGLSDSVKNELRSVEARYRNLQRELRAVSQYKLSPNAFSGLSGEDMEKLENIKENMIFLGFIDLGDIPQFTTFNSLWFVGMLCFVFSVVQTAVMRYIQKRTMPDMPNAGGMKFMFVMGPLFSLFIVFTVPAGAGLYWAVSYIFMIAQSVIIYKAWPPEKMREEARARVQAKDVSINAVAKVVDVDEEGNEVVKEEKLSEMSSKEQKEYFRKKLEQARKEDLEKYGETPDIDLSEYDKPKQEESETDSESENEEKDL